MSLKQFVTFLLDMRCKYSKGSKENIAYKLAVNQLIGKFGSTKSGME